MKTAVFTIGSRNYFALVKTLMGSLADTNPQWDRFVGVADSLQFLQEDGYKLLSIDDIDLPHPKQMEFRYSIMEFNTAIKPFIFKALFKKFGYDRVIYLDPDIFVYDKMEELEEAFDRGSSFVLTPHFTELWDDDKKPDEVSILLSGTYNCGFLGLAKSDETYDFLEWWGEKLEKQCIVDIEHGIFVDQKWVDLVPGFFDNVFILRHEGYNTAYWNLSHRKPEKRDGKFYYNNQPLRFFHFSGLDPSNIENVSKHQNRYKIDEIGITKELFEDYAAAVLSNDHASYRTMPYAFATYENGDPVSDAHRHMYKCNRWIQEMCGENPFAKNEIFAVLDHGQVGGPRVGGDNRAASAAQKKLDKFRNYFSIMNKWIKLRDAAASMEKYLVDHGYTKIAIYGMGELGMRLYETLKDSEQVKIVYGIDKLMKAPVKGVEVYKPDDELPEANVIIISATFDFSAIKKSIADKVDYPIISLEEVVMGCDDI